MLIFDSKQGKFGTQKPKQWGSISAVRSAVFRNAEAMGIDPRDILICAPPWAGAGNILMSTGSIEALDMHGSDVDWQNRGVKIGRSTTYGITHADSDALRSITDQFTIHIVIDELLQDPPQHGKCFQKDFDGDPYVSYGLEFYGTSNFYLFHAINSSFADNKIGLGYGFHATDSVNVVGTGGSRGLELYDNGKLAASNPNIVGSVNYYDSTDLHILGTSSFNSAFTVGSIFSMATLLKTQVDPSVAVFMIDTPYALLQPNPTPLIFDWGAGGGTLLSYLYDSAAITTTNITSLFDSSAKASSSVSDIYDSNVQVSKTTEQVFDSAAKVISVITDSYDTSAIVQSIGTLVFNFDTLVRVTTNISDEYDTGTACSILCEYSYDTMAIVATVIEKLVDSSIPVTSVLIQLYDTVCAVTEATPSTGTLTPETIDAIATAVWSKLLDNNLSATELMRLMASALLGKVSGASSNEITFRDLADTKDRIKAITDEYGNRTNVTLDGE